MSKELIEWEVDSEWPLFGLARGSNNPHASYFPQHPPTFPQSRGAAAAQTEPDHFETEPGHLGINIANFSHSIRHQLGSTHHLCHHHGHHHHRRHHHQRHHRQRHHHQRQHSSIPS